MLSLPSSFMAEGTIFRTLEEAISLLQGASTTHSPQIATSLTNILTSLNTLKAKIDHNQAGECSSSRPSGLNNSTSSEPFQVPYPLCLDFPRFDGIDPLGWIFKAEQFFEFHNTPDEQRLTIASFYMDGPDLALYQWMHKNHQPCSWTAFADSVKIRFRPSDYVDHLELNGTQPTPWKKLTLEDKKKIMGNPGMAIAKSSYDGLEPRVKLCFLSLSIFPENSIIRKRSLIYWWIGEGFVDDDQNAERKAEECFKKLCHSGLVEAVQKQYSRSPRSCRLDPWIRWMAIEIAKETMFFDFDDSDGKPISSDYYNSHCTRRACVAAAGTTKMMASGNLKANASKLRTLFNVDVNCIECNEEEFKKLKKLVTLQLGRWRTAPDHHIELVNPTFLDHLKHLKNLRYLGLQGISRIKELSQIQQLSELRVLDLRACHNLEKLPAEIASLKKLTHLDVSECYFLEYMPEGLGDLSELQLLNGFVVNNWSQDACKLIELTKLDNLQKLSISLGTEAMVIVDGVSNPISEINEVLNPIGEIKSLQSLRITWGFTRTATDHSKARWARVKKLIRLKSRIVINWAGLVLSVPRLKQPPLSLSSSSVSSSSKITLTLPPNLTKLDLQCYPEEEPPRFIKRKLGKVKSLEKLYFRGGKLKSLSGIEEVSEVKFIRLRFLKYFKMEEKDFRMEFPKLEKMIPYECPYIKTRISTEER